MGAKRSILSTAIHSILFAGTAVGLSSISSTAQAQDQEGEARELDRVQVTGSRIRRTDTEGPSPVQVIDRDQIDRSSYTRLGDLLQDLTASGSAINTTFNAPDSGGDGSERVSLRNLGPERTLVLVNGRRWVNGTTMSGVSSSTDLSTIPLAVVDRVEVLKGGASSVYGSDAIAGVVNVIMRQDFNDMRVDLHTGQWDEGDGEETALSFTLGRSTDRGNIVFNYSETDQKPIMARDREITRVPQWGADTFGGAISRGSSATPQGRFLFSDPDTGESFDLTTDPGAPGEPTAGDFRPYDPTSDAFNFAPDNYLQIPLEQRSAYVQGSHDVNDRVTFFAEATYNNRQSVQLQAPIPLFLGSGGILPLSVGVSADNPYNPFGYDLDPTDNLTVIGRRFVEAGTRDYYSDVHTWRLASGLEGDFMAADRYFNWDVTYLYSHSVRTQRTENLLNHDRLERALGPASDCTDECVPFNIFGGQAGTGVEPGSGGSITQEMVDYVTYTAVDKNEQTLDSVLANLSGDLLEMPAGPLAFAAGFETRREFAADTPDSLAASGAGAASVSGGQRAPTSGRVNMDAVYAELNMPLLSGVTGAEMLELNLSARHSDYDTFGSETTSRFSFLWRPVDDLLLRATYAEGFRAPGVQDLFGGAGVQDPQLDDPCSDFLNTGVSQDVIDNCIDQGVPADGSYTQINPQIRINTGGNPELGAETSESVSLGFVYSPSNVEGLDVTLDYYDIEVTNSISTIGAQNILNACTQSERLCDLIGRSSDGSVNRLLDVPVNIGSTEVSGVDLGVNYQFPTTAFGNLATRFEASWLNNYTEVVPDFSDQNAAPEERELAGRLVQGQPERSFPELKANLDLIWSQANWGANWSIQHIEGYTENCSDGLQPSFVDVGLCSDPNNPAGPQNRLGSTVYHDAQLSYSLDTVDVTVTGGIDNVFDKTPPIATSVSANSFDPSQHRIPGRFGYVRLTAHF